MLGHGSYFIMIPILQNEKLKLDRIHHGHLPKITQLVSGRGRVCTPELTHLASMTLEIESGIWNVYTIYLYTTFSSVAQSCRTLGDPMNHSTPGLPVHHQLLEFIQTHVHQLSDAIQPSHPLSSPSPPAPNPPSIRVFSNESTLRMKWPKYWSFSLSISPSKEHPGLISFRTDWLDLFAVQGNLKSLL